MPSVVGGGNPVNTSVLSTRPGIPLDEIPQCGSPVKPFPIMRKTGMAGEFEDKETTNFMKLMDFLTEQKSNKVTDQAFRDNYRKQSLN